MMSLFLQSGYIEEFSNDISSAFEWSWYTSVNFSLWLPSNILQNWNLREHLFNPYVIWPFTTFTALLWTLTSSFMSFLWRPKLHTVFEVRMHQQRSRVGNHIESICRIPSFFWLHFTTAINGKMNPPRNVSEQTVWWQPVISEAEGCMIPVNSCFPRFNSHS